jgi:DNA-binding MarR family transcriptional regulator
MQVFFGQGCILQNFLDNPTYEAGLTQSRAFRALNNFLNTLLGQFDLSLSEWKLLGHLNEVKNMRPGEISGLLYIKQPVTTRLLKSLEKKGLLERRRSEQDNRQVSVGITRKGSLLVRKTERHVRLEMRDFLSGIDVKELEVYGQVLEQIAQKL